MSPALGQDQLLQRARRELEYLALSGSEHRKLRRVKERPREGTGLGALMLRRRLWNDQFQLTF